VVQLVLEPTDRSLVYVLSTFQKNILAQRVPELNKSLPIMTRPSTPPILSELISSSSAAGQVAALRALKNDIIGHEQRKEIWIRHGVLEHIARILNTHKGSGKKRYREVNGGASHPKRRGSTTDEEEARLQAIAVVGSFAHGQRAGFSNLTQRLVH
jgi:hypothetical protein